MSRGTQGKQPEAIVRELTRNELESLVLSQLEADNDVLASAILARFGDAGGKDEWRGLVRRCRENHCDNPHGIVDDAEGLVGDLEELRRRAKNLPGKDANGRAFALYGAIIEAIAPDAYEADDHEGVLIETVSETLRDILELTERKDTAATCLADIRAWAQSNSGSAWARNGDGWDYDLFEIDLAAARGKAEKDSSLALCEGRCTVKRDEFHDEYLAGKLGALICSALAEDPGELSAFIERHLDLDPVREVAIRRAREARNLEQALMLARDGLTLSEKRDTRGTGDRYAHEIVAIIEAQGESDAALEFIERRAIATASLEWYREIVKRVPGASDRKPITDRVLSAITPRAGGVAAGICAMEKRWAELLALATDRTGIMEEHYRVLGKHYPECVARWLEKGIRRELNSTSGRGTYRSVASRVSDYRRVAGIAAARALVDEMVTAHSNRPAMIEELRKAVSPKA